MKLKGLLLQSVMPFMFFLITWNISFHTPMHSDDFGTFLGGLPSWEMHWQRYFSWSGRIVADVISAIIIGIDNHVLISCVSAMVTVSFIITMTFFVLKAVNAKTKYFTILFVTLFMLYWIGNPNLGQTTFWIVGSANYLWTNFFIILFLLLIVSRLNKENGWFSYFLVFLLGMVAGCTNENMSVTLLFVVAVLIIKVFVVDKKNISFLATGFSGVLIGACILLGAPGNRVRLHAEGGAWLDYSVSQKIIFGLKTMTHVCWIDKVIALAIAALLFILLTVAIKNKTSGVFSKNKKEWFFIVIFIAAGTLANIVMLASPGYPLRAMNGQFVLYLCSFGFLSCLCIKLGKIKWLCGLTLVIALIFGVSYCLIDQSYRSAFEQFKVRAHTIEMQKNTGIDIVEVPDYFFTTLLKESDRFDTFRADPMAQYFGVKKIVYFVPEFDYSVLSETHNCLNKHSIENGAETISCIYGYTELFGLYSTLVIPVPDDIVEKSQKHRMGLHIFYSDGQQRYLNFVPKFVKIDGKWLTHVKEKGLQITDIDTVKIEVKD